MSDAYKIFKQLQEREKEAQQYKKYEREDLIDEIINLQQENQQLKERIDRTLEKMKSEIIEIKDRGFYIYSDIGAIEEILKGESDE